MAKEFVTREELESQLRVQGIEDVSQVRAAYMESTGQISALTDGGEHPPPPGRRVG